jgi:hypothetical protein
MELIAFGLAAQELLHLVVINPTHIATEDHDALAAGNPFMKISLNSIGPLKRDWAASAKLADAQDYKNYRKNSCCCDEAALPGREGLCRVMKNDDQLHEGR